MVHQEAARLDATFAALADPTRRAILLRLRRGEATVNELAAPFDMSLNAVSKHLRVLERAGLVARSRDAQRRPCRLAAAPLKDATGWMEAFRRDWEARLDRLDAFARELHAKSKAAAPDADPLTKPKPRSPTRPRATQEKPHARRRRVRP